jgi:hypothetical protein
VKSFRDEPVQICHNIAPPRLRAITPPGRTLSATVDGLRIWAETHIDKVLKVQKQYDAGLQREAS